MKQNFVYTNPCRLNVFANTNETCPLYHLAISLKKKKTFNPPRIDFPNIRAPVYIYINSKLKILNFLNSIHRKHPSFPIPVYYEHARIEREQVVVSRPGRIEKKPVAVKGSYVGVEEGRRGETDKRSTGGAHGKSGCVHGGGPTLTLASRLHREQYAVPLSVQVHKHSPYFFHRKIYPS